MHVLAGGRGDDSAKAAAPRSSSLPAACGRRLFAVLTFVGPRYRTVMSVFGGGGGRGGGGAPRGGAHQRRLLVSSLIQDGSAVTVVAEENQVQAEAVGAAL